MRRILSIVLIVLFSVQSLWAISPKEYLELAIKGEKIISEYNKKFFVISGAPLILGGLIVKDNGLKVGMLGLGGFFVGQGLFYDHLPFSNNLEKQYMLNKDKMDDAIAIRILKNHKNKILFSRRIFSIFGFLLSLGDYESSSGTWSKEDENIFMKSILFATSIAMWFIPTPREEMIEAIIKGNLSSKTQRAKEEEKSGSLNLIPVNRGLALSYNF